MFTTLLSFAGGIVFLFILESFFPELTLKLLTKFALRSRKKMKDLFDKIK